MEDFPPLGSPPQKETGGRKTNKNAQPKLIATSPPDSLKLLAQLIEKSEDTNEESTEIERPEWAEFETEDLGHSTTGTKESPIPGTSLAGISLHSDPFCQTTKEETSPKKQNKSKKKTKFVLMDLGHDTDVRTKSKEEQRKGICKQRERESLHSHFSRPFTSSSHEPGNQRIHACGAQEKEREKCLHYQWEDELVFGEVGEVLDFDRKSGSFHARVAESGSFKSDIETNPVAKEVIYQREPSPHQSLEVKHKQLPSDKSFTGLCSTGAKPTSTSHVPNKHLDVPKTVTPHVGHSNNGIPKKGKKHKPVMKPAPTELLGFTTSRERHSHKRSSDKKQNLGDFLKIPESKPRRRKAKEKRILIIPTIQSDESDTAEDSVDLTCTRDQERDEPHNRELALALLDDLDSKPSTVIGLTLARSTDALVHLLRKGQLSLEDNLVLVSVISRGCTCHVVQKSGLQILSCLQNTNVFNDFLRSLTTTMNANVHTLDGLMLLSFFKDVMKILHAQKISSTGNDPTVIPRLLLMAMAKRWKEFLGDGHHNSVILELETLKEVKTEASAAAILTTDDNFRQVPIMPTNDDINPNIKPSLKQNKLKGSYSTVDEYLDLQFRLLREDFIQPLREGISEYQDLMHQKDKRALRLYQNVKIKRIICSENGIVYRLQFDVGRLSHVDWRNTKRLMYGAMVCISTDKFVTVRFATISDRKPERLEQGKVDVKFDNKVKLDSKTVFAMVETPALFEAYRHILKGLQNIDTSSLAFKRYFVECQNTVFQPQYLTRKYSYVYDFTSLTSRRHKPPASLPECNDTASVAVDNDDESSNIVEILSAKYWPTAENLCMDDSQFRAFRTALTKELAIIQGPPGTGKTYVGLKIMKALLNNAHAWNPCSSKPLLVVCYTNHALDQFLEGIVSFFKGEVLRVGGRSKNEKMISHNLNRRRSDLFRNRGILDDDISDILEIRQKLRDDFMSCQREIEEYGQQIDATATGILHEDQLKPFMKQHYRQIKKQAENAQFALLEWLDIKGIGKSKKDQKSESSPKTNIDVSEEEEEDEIVKQRKVDDVDEFVQQQTLQLSFLRRQCCAISLADCDLTDKEWKLKYQSNMKKASRQTLKTRIRKEIIMISKMDQTEADSVQNVWTLPQADRWKLYRFWVDQFCQELHHQMEPLKAECQNAADRYKEANGLVDKYIFEHSSVIGLTTTGAARYHSILGDIQPPVIIVEEAAEVLEGHIVTSLSPGCQHLILIGDHQQLRPSPNVYELAQRYNLDLSLFERMINNGLHCDTLELQHRMRPSISRVMRHIYRNLKDHESVLSHPDVMGVTENIFFINHSVPETENVELLSHLNVFEAEYMTELCRYLLKQGYSPSQITVLSTYSAQVSRLRSLMRDEIREGVMITAVDNYQGEENDIILLSLVRSNKERRIGFLKTDNRICVALSRARIGLYVIGNFNLLSSQSQTWKNIVEDLKTSRQFGPGPELYCQTHPQDKKVVATDPKMFQLVPEGGCMKSCEFVLNCGHNCRRKCHSYDPMHENYDCLEPCQKIICSRKHTCPGKCSEECNPCEVLVDKTIPGCGHVEEVECYLDPEDHKCQHACDEILECGHKCGNICGYDHICYNTIRKEWPCGHEGEILCIDKDTAPCPCMCSTKLECGHACQGSCQECSEGRLHRPCRERCGKVLVCGHECKSFCSLCPPCGVACENSCQHGKCDKVCGEKCQPCLEPCTWSCSHTKCKMKCSEPCGRPRCDKRCRKQLKCKHTCIGLCGEVCPTYCRKCDAVDLRSFLPDTEDIDTARFILLVDCGHIVEVKTLDNIFDSLQNQQEIQLPCCPWCSTTVRHNDRYGAIIKKILMNVELTKAADENLFTNSVEEELRIRIQDDLEALEPSSRAEKLLADAGRDRALLAAVKSQTEFMLQLEATKRIGILSLPEEDFIRDIIQDIENFREWLQVQRDVFTAQESSDAQNELFRINTSLFLGYISDSVERADDDNDDDVDDDDDVTLLLEEVKQIKKCITSKRRFTKEMLDKVMGLKMRWNQLHPDETGAFQLNYENIQCWKSISMKQGHWFSCPNSRDHVFNVENVKDSAMGRCPICESIKCFDNDESDGSDGS